MLKAFPYFKYIAFSILALLIVLPILLYFFGPQIFLFWLESQDLSTVGEKPDFTNISSFSNIKHIILYFFQVLFELMDCTDKYGRVHEDNFSDNLNNLLSRDPFWQKVYMDYRERHWIENEDDRLSDNYSDNDYDPRQSKFLVSQVYIRVPKF